LNATGDAKRRNKDIRFVEVFPNILYITGDNNIVASAASALLDVQECIMVTEQDGHMIAAIGVKDLIIAHSPDATLVCHRDHADKLKTLLEQIEQQGDGSYL